MNWKLNPTVLGLMFLTVSPGISGISNDTRDKPRPDVLKAVTETFIIGSIGAYITRSWWPLAGPLGYLMFDAFWNTTMVPRETVDGMESPEWA